MIKSLAKIKKKDIYELGHFNVNFQENNIAYLTYKYENYNSIGIFTFEKDVVQISTNLKDGTYLNLIDNSKISVINGKITINKKPIIIEFID